MPPREGTGALSGNATPEEGVLYPWYNKGVGGYRSDYNDWLSTVIGLACKISEHVFVWGFPEVLAHQIAAIPKGFRLVAWLTWYYKNCPSVIRGWRSAQNTCLHLASDGADMYPEHFLTTEQLNRWKSGKMRFIPSLQTHPTCLLYTSPSPRD